MRPPGASLLAKRLLDIGVASTVLLVFSPFLLAVGILIRRSLGPPILFRQLRSGLHGRPFTLVKFRTMRDAVDAAGDPLPDGERLTAVGRFLRSTSIDELPELWNVLRGDMSLVGPRPLLVEYLERYTPDQARRHDIRPGITGWAQVNGRNALTWEEKFRRDVWYVENWSLLLDLKILLITLRRVFDREGISHHGSATVEKFRGSIS